MHHDSIFSLCFSPSLRICYVLQSCLDECHWSRGYMEMLTNHVLPCLTCTLVPCFCLPRSCNVACLFHGFNMSTCYFCSLVCPVFHQVLICVIKLLLALIILVESWCLWTWTLMIIESCNPYLKCISSFCSFGSCRMLFWWLQSAWLLFWADCYYILFWVYVLNRGSVWSMVYMKLSWFCM